MQSKRNSFIESAVQTFIGLAVSFLIQLIIYPLLSIPVSIGQNVIITLVFTVVSIIRGYLVRRLFNKFEHGKR